MDAIVTAFIDALTTAFGMFWEVLWPLILGFALSGAVQAVALGATHLQLSGGYRSS